MNAPITIAGSLNMDFVVQVERLPQPGETVLGGGFVTLPGGKGANQACAAGRLGGRVRMLGRVGDDVFGRQLVESLARAGVDTSTVRVSAATASGVALIFVETGGQNQIVVASGANGLLSPEDVEMELAAGEGLLLVQLETPLATTERAVALASRRGMTVVLDPAPARPLSDALLAQVSLLTPNESEAMVLLERRGASVSLAEAPEIARALLKRGPRGVILKLGEKGAFLADGSGGQHFPGFEVTAVDATAAGDAFAGALGVALAEGRPIAEAIPFANAAAALSVTRLGAQASMPSRPEVDALLASRPRS